MASAVGCPFTLGALQAAESAVDFLSDAALRRDEEDRLAPSNHPLKAPDVMGEMRLPSHHPAHSLLAPPSSLALRWLTEFLQATGRGMLARTPWCMVSMAYA